MLLVCGYVDVECVVIRTVVTVSSHYQLSRFVSHLLI